MSDGPLICREPNQEGSKSVTKALCFCLPVFWLKKIDNSEEQTEPRVLIIEVEILPIPDYKPDTEVENAKEGNLNHRITHYPPENTRH
jgi:hypothetical protein